MRSKFSPKEIRLGNARLRKLARFLKKVPPEHFRMWVVTSYDIRGKNLFSHFLSIYSRPRPGCGTIACAVGWAPVALPEIFKYNRSGCPCLRNKSVLGLEAASEVFYLTQRQTKVLFGGERPRYRTPTEVAAGLLKFVEKRQSKLGSIKCKAKSRTTRSASRAVKR